jgi:hypothetical protein
MTDSINPNDQSTQGPIGGSDFDDMTERIERLGGEIAPDISPEEFTRLQETGSLHIDSMGRVRVNRHDDRDPGISLRKRRAWYTD